MCPAFLATRVVGLASLLILALASPVGAFDVNGGCSLDITSTDANGATLDTASGGSGGGSGGTQADPFQIDWDGEVSWVGTSGSVVFKNHSWGVSVFNIPTPVRGGDPNDDGDTTGTGSAGVGANAPFRFTGLYFVSGEINGDGGAHCDGSGWFQLIGNPLTTIPFWIAVLIALIGLLLVMSSRGQSVQFPTAPAGPPADAPSAPVPPPSQPDPPASSDPWDSSATRSGEDES